MTLYETIVLSSSKGLTGGRGQVGRRVSRASYFRGPGAVPPSRCRSYNVSIEDVANKSRHTSSAPKTSSSSYIQRLSLRMAWTALFIGVPAAAGCEVWRNAASKHRTVPPVLIVALTAIFVELMIVAPFLARRCRQLATRLLRRQ